MGMLRSTMHALATYWPRALTSVIVRLETTMNPWRTRHLTVLGLIIFLTITWVAATSAQLRPSERDTAMWRPSGSLLFPPVGDRSDGSLTVRASSMAATVVADLPLRRAANAASRSIDYSGGASADVPPPVESAVSISSSLNPSLSTRPPLLIATVSVPSGVTPTGSVEFFDGAASLGVRAVRVVDGVALATISGSRLTVAGSPHTITARYSGDGALAGSVSNAIAQVVRPGTYRFTGIGRGSNGLTVAALNSAGEVAGTANTGDTSGTRAFLWTEGAGFADLGTLGGNSSSASAISNTGLVAGYSTTTGEAELHPFAWTPAQGIIDLGGPRGSAFAVNDKGMVVGHLAFPDGSLHAFVWTQIDGVIDLGTLGGDERFARAINDEGTIVGESDTAATAIHAFAWTRNGGMVDLGTLGGGSSGALAINRDGTIVGQSNLAGDTEGHAFVWTPTGGMVDLGTLGGSFSTAFAVNNDGTITGFSTVPNSPVGSPFPETHAFVWTQTGGLVDLGTLGGTRSFATAISDHGVVVGSSTTAGDAESHAFMWTEATGMLDIGPSGGNSEAVSINASGQVLVARATHGFLLTPVAADTRTIPTITWTDPADITFGTPLDAAQLNATADVPGTFEYVPPAGTILNPGSGQILTATFTPTDEANYAPASATVRINVSRVTPIIVWPRPTAIVYGTPLGSSQLNATANVAGAFVYTPSPGTILPIGAARPLTVVFTPADTAHYSEAIASVTIDVFSASAPGQPPFQVLRSFSYGDGAYPGSGLIEGRDKLFYGTTEGGGSSGAGTVFRMTASGSITTLHSFSYSDGGNPWAGLIQARDGAFYGTTPYYGPNGYGTVYRIDPSGGLTTVHAFNYTDGGYPYGGVIQASDDFFYGTTVYGGASGVGTIYRMDTVGTITTIHSFSYSDGANPYGGLVQASDGFIYGTTSSGGPGGVGTLFRLDAAGTLTTVHAFAYSDGAFPVAALIQGSDTFLYGTTSGGGPTGGGTVFRADAAGMVTTLHAFSYTDGANPRAGLVQATDGFFYGTTSGGAAMGTVYRMDAAGSLSSMRVFTGSDGSTPVAGLIQASDGFLYGTTLYGGFQGSGTVFRLRLARPRLSASQLFVAPVFAVYGGAGYLSAALNSNNVPVVGRSVTFTLNGATVGTVTTDANGFAFFGPVSLAGINPGTYVAAVSASFAGDASYLPSSGTNDLVIARQTPYIAWAPPSPIVYGTALGDAQLTATASVPGTFVYTPPAGTILAVGAQQTLSVAFTPSDAVYYNAVTTSVFIDVSSASDTQPTLQTLHSFTGTDGSFPYGGLIQADDGTFYGTTTYGGAMGYGSVYRMDVTGAVATLHTFEGADGAYPYGDLLQGRDGLFYGTTAFGGASDYGTVFRMDGSGTVTVLHTFTYTDGAFPYAGLIQARDGLLYGATSEGGATGYGTVFRIDTTGALTTLHVFNNADGAFPYAALVQGLDGSFYGATLQGGPSGYGVAYRMAPDGTVALLHSFVWSDGAYPYGALIKASDGALLGTTSYGGSNGSGTVFRINATGAVTTLLTFSGGRYPYARLIQRSDGFFYGLTSQGGSGGGGTLFRMDAGGRTTTLHEFGWTDGASPYAGLVEGRDGFLYGTTQDGGSHNRGTVFRVGLRTTTQLVVASATGVYGGTTALSATLTAAGVPLAGRALTFTLAGRAIGTALTDGNGFAAIADVSLAGINPGTYSGAIAAGFAGDDTHAPSNGSGDLLVAKLAPVVTWPAPASITYGTALDATQLNATANIEGTFLYTPASGAILPVGAGQLLSVFFAPLNQAIYASQVAYVSIDVVSATPPNPGSFQVLHSFTGADGSSPFAALTRAGDDSFYGTTAGGGPDGGGTVYRIDGTWTVTTLHAFTSAEGVAPYAGVIQGADGSLYGTTVSGGPGGYGTLYRIDSAGAATTLHSFNFDSGVYPYGTLLQATDGSFYGTTYYGGAGYGVIYRLDASGVVTTLHTFGYYDGAYPFSGLIEANDGTLYGTTIGGGPTGQGTVYRLDTEGNFATMHTFGDTDGAYPYAGVMQATDGSFYGTTSSGGPTGNGTVYRMTATGTVRILHAFVYTDGANPYGGLVQGTDGFFYGTTAFGGAAAAGTLYRIDAGGNLTTLHDFDYRDGTYPYAGLVQGRDGSLYGTTYGGGIGGGTIFRVAFPASTQLAVSDASGAYGGTTTLSATLTFDGSPLAGQTVHFTLRGVAAGMAITDDRGVATISGVGLLGIDAGRYTAAVRAMFAGDGSYVPRIGTADLVVEKATPTLTWPQPAAIGYGTPLDSTQLNAMASVPGTFVYSPPAGTILPPGGGQLLSVEFTPFDTSNYTSAHATATIDVFGTPSFPFSDFGTFGVGQLQIPLSTTGGDGVHYLWSVTSGSLPNGVSIREDVPAWFSPNQRSGLIGVATTPGTYRFTLRVTSGGQTFETECTLKISALVIAESYQLPDAFVGEPYSYTLSSAGTAQPVTWMAPNGVPAGMTLNSDGVLSGTPTTAGFSFVGLTVSDGVDTVYGGVNLRVSAIGITPAGVLPNATQFAAYSATLAATGGSGPYIFTVGGLPPDLVADTSGSISGSVTAGPGNWRITVTATDANGASYTRSMSIDIIGVPPTLPQVVPFGAHFDDCTIGIGCERGIGVYGGGTAPFTWSATGLPPGMWIRSGSGNTPSNFTPGDAQVGGAPAAAGTYAIEVSVTDALGVSATNTFPLHVSTLLKTDYLPIGNIGEAYSARLRVIGGTLPYTVAQISGRLPAGLNFDATTLMVSGTPRENGSFNPTFRFIDAAGEIFEQTSYFPINAGMSTVSINTNSDLGTITLGLPYSNQLFACCAASYAWSVPDGTLPPGVSLSSGGLLSGTPTSPGTYTFLVQAADATDNTNYGARQFTLVVTPVSVTTNFDLPDGFVNTSYHATLTATGGTGPYTWALARWNYLPPGITLAADGTLGGTPTASGQFFFTVTVTDVAGNRLTRNFRVAVYAEGAAPPVRHLQGPDFDFGLGEIQLPLAAAGGIGTYTWEVVGGSLPPGLSLRTDGPSWFPGNASAGVMGVATTTGTYAFTLRVTSGSQRTDRQYQMRISSVVFNDLYTLPDAFVGTSYDYGLSALSDNGPVTWAATNPLPPGLTLDASGRLSGTPTVSGLYILNVRMTDGLGTAYNGIGLNIFDIAITTPGVLPNATQSAPYTTMVTASGGSGSYTFTTTSLPNGFSLDPSGTISGTTTTGPGTWRFTLTAADMDHRSYRKNMSLDVIGVPPALQAIGVGNFDDCTVAVRCERTITVFAGGTAPFTWSASGMPRGMSIRSGTDTSPYLTPGDAQIVGAPTATGTYDVTITVTDADGMTARNTFPLRVGPIVQRDFLADGVVGVAYVSKVRLIGGTLPYTGVQIGGQLPAGLSFDPATFTVRGTPLESGFFNTAFEFTDALGATLRNTDYFSISGGSSTVAITTGSNLGSATLGLSYSNQLFACCAGSYVWSVNPEMLPPGLSLASGGLLSGTPTSPGTYTFLVQAADTTDNRNYGARQFTLVVTPVSITTGFSLPDGFVNTSYHAMLTATGGTGPFTWALARWNYLPPGITFAADGTLSGTPTASGQFFFTATLTNAASDVLTRSFGIAVYAEGAAPPIRHLQGPDFDFGLGEIQLALAAAGGNGTYTWELVGGSLPPGLSLRTDGPSWFPANASAGVMGVATTTGTYTFTLRATSGGQSTDRQYQIRISSIIFSDLNTLPDAFVGTSYDYRLSAISDRGPVTWAATNPLPPGLTLDASGMLSGTPAVSGYYSLNLRMTDGLGTAYNGVSLNIFDIAITTPGVLPNATQFASYTTTVAASGGSGSYIFTTNSLPSGLSLDRSGTISGTATAGPGKWSFTLTATDTQQRSYRKNLSIDVIGVPPALPAIGVGNFDDCTVAVRCERTINVFSGGTAPFTWTASGMPPGMSIRSGTGTSPYLTPGDAQLVGAPTATGTYDITIAVMDADGTIARNTFPLRVVPIVQRDFLANGVVGVAYASKLRLIGGTLPYTAVQIGGQLPAGLSFDPATFMVRGTPLESGFFNAAFEFTDALGATLRDTNYFSISGGSSTVTITMGSNLGSATLGLSYSRQLFACCAASYGWSVTDGMLPDGLTLSSTGLLSGTPTTAGSYTFLVQAADASTSANYGTRQFMLVVTPVSITTNFALPDAFVNTSYHAMLTATGGTGAFTWALARWNYLPPGITLAADGTLSGTPTASGQFFFSVTVTDAASDVLTRGFRIAVYAEGTYPPLNLPLGPTFSNLNPGTVMIRLSATGGLPPYHYSITPGADPVPGMRVQNGQPLPTNFVSTITAGYLGVITTAGTYNTSIRITDALGGTFDRAITIRISALQVVSLSNPPKGTVNTPYSFVMTPYGGSGQYSWSATNLPNGLLIDASGRISGTPTEAATRLVTVTLRDLVTSESILVGVTLTVDPFAIATDGILVTGIVGTPYEQAFVAAECDDCSWTVVAGLSPGFSLSAAGVLSGTPTSAFNRILTVQASGSAGTVQKVFSLSIAASTPQPLSVSNGAELGYVTIGGFSAIALFARGGTPPYSWSLQSGILPTGIRLENSGETLAANLGAGFPYLAGRATGPIGTYHFTLAVTDDAGAVEAREFTWVISPLSLQYLRLPVAGNPFIANSSYTQPLLAVGGTGSYTWASNIAMPEGLALDSSTGVITGTPSNTGAFVVPIRVTDDAGSTTVANVTLAIAAPPSTSVNVGAP